MFSFWREFRERESARERWCLQGWLDWITSKELNMYVLAAKEEDLTVDKNLKAAGNKEGEEFFRKIRGGRKG